MVTPGKLPVFWRSPVKLLNKEDLPAFGFPINAIFARFANPYTDLHSLTFTVEASSFLIDKVYPDTFKAIGSPNGAV